MCGEERRDHDDADDATSTPAAIKYSITVSMVILLTSTNQTPLSQNLSLYLG